MKTLLYIYTVYSNGVAGLPRYYSVWHKEAFVIQGDVKKQNARWLTMLARYMNLCPTAIDGETVQMLTAAVGISTERAFAECVAALFDLDAAGRDKAFFHSYILPSLHLLPIERYESDPYKSGVRFPSEKMGRFSFRTLTMPAFTPFAYGDEVLLFDGRVLPQIGFFTEPYSYPALFEGEREWMTLLPIEEETIAAAASRAHGRVVTFGLGLGYFAYLSSMRCEVTHVTVVERSPDVISLFREVLLPQFPHAEKIEIVEDDAFRYAEEVLPASDFDYAFFDIWHDAGDGREAYLRLKEAEKKFSHIKTEYWIEKSIKIHLDNTHFDFT